MSLKKKLMVLLVVCMTAICLAGCGNTAMIVNGEEVPQAVADYYIKAGTASLEAYGLDPESEDAAQYLTVVEEQAVTYCEQFAIIRAEAKSRGLEVTEEEIEEQFNTEKEAFESEESYQEFLETNELSEDTIKWIVESQLYYQLLFDEINKDVTCTDEQLKAAYEENPAAYDTESVSYILIQPEDLSSDEAWAAAKTEADEVIAKLNDGGDFAELAAEYSDDASTKANGGVLPTPFTAESQDLDSDFVTAAFNLTEVGAYTTEPVKSESFGYFIIKLDEKVTGWETLKEDIETALVGTEKDDNFNAFMDEAMANMTIDKEYKYKYADKSADKEESEAEPAAEEGTAEGGEAQAEGDGAEAEGTEQTNE